MKAFTSLKTSKYILACQVRTRWQCSRQCILKILIKGWRKASWASTRPRRSLMRSLNFQKKAALSTAKCWAPIVELIIWSWRSSTNLSWINRIARAPQGTDNKTRLVKSMKSRTKMNISFKPLTKSHLGNRLFMTCRTSRSQQIRSSVRRLYRPTSPQSWWKHHRLAVLNPLGHYWDKNQLRTSYVLWAIRTTSKIWLVLRSRGKSTPF